ncbi:MAG: stage II sporulation protein M [Lachnospiraceae bacterium]|nr:stage II sporulation protein M [Lachnospiraceae bacterium]
MNKFNTEEQVEKSAVCSVVPEQDAYIDYRKLHYKNTIPDNRVLVFLTGFCVGMVFFYLTGGQNASVGSLLDREHLALMQNFEVNRSGLFEYVIGLRLRQLLFGVICALSSIGGLMAYSIMGWCGFEVGLIIFTMVYQYGIKGILLTFSMVLPQGIFYGILFMVIFRKYWMSDKKSCHNEMTVKGEHQHHKIETIKTIVLVMLMFSIGILCEVYINPEIMRKIALLFP